MSAQSIAKLIHAPSSSYLTEYAESDFFSRIPQRDEKHSQQPDTVKLSEETEAALTRAEARRNEEAKAHEDRLRTARTEFRWKEQKAAHEEEMARLKARVAAEV